MTFMEVKLRVRTLEMLEKVVGKHNTITNRRDDQTMKIKVVMD